MVYVLCPECCGSSYEKLAFHCLECGEWSRNKDQNSEMRCPYCNGKGEFFDKCLNCGGARAFYC